MTFMRRMREISRPVTRDNKIFDKHELNEKAKAIINVIQAKMKQKKLADEGK